MPDNLTADQRKKNMQHIRSKDTSIEVRLRKALWHEGIHYRKNYAALPGKPDIVITKWKIAIFCDSSFWHGKDFETKKPVDTNHEYWDAKIRRNIQRDIEVNQQYEDMSWTVLRFWDTDINKHLDDCVASVKNTIEQKQKHIDLIERSIKAGELYVEDRNDLQNAQSSAER